MTTLLAVSILIQKHVKSEIVRPKASMHYACRHSHELLQTWIGSMKIFLQLHRSMTELRLYYEKNNAVNYRILLLQIAVYFWQFYFLRRNSSSSKYPHLAY